MGNPEFITQIPQHTQHVTHVYHQAHHAVHHAASHPAVRHTVHKGVSMFKTFIDIVVTAIVALPAGFGLGWYVRGRGVTGVKTDIKNVSNEVNKVATEVSAIKA